MTTNTETPVSWEDLRRETDLFAVFGLPRRLVVDLDELERRFYRLSRALHPDAHQDGSPAERAASMQATALVNRAYQTLRDPVRRALYWLSLHGESLGRDNERVPPELAALVFEVQEQLEDLRTARRAGDGAGLEREVCEARDDVRQRLADVERELHELFARTDASDDTAAALAATKDVLARLHYLRTLARDVEKELEPEWNA